mmetsp:Transcript_16309/g.39019  ORF Transcript_16309/g.39019 Transcript_16309/m.39019 type:complete len:207 (-) Transcript_16309:981-1601(-)
MIHPLHFTVVQHVCQRHLLPSTPLPKNGMQIRQQCPQLFLLPVFLAPRLQFGLQALPYHILLGIRLGLLGLPRPQLYDGLLLRLFHVVDARVHRRLDVVGFSHGVGSGERYPFHGRGGSFDSAVSRGITGCARRIGRRGGIRLAVLDGTLNPSLIHIVPNAIGRGLLFGVFALQLFGARFPRLGASGGRYRCCPRGHGIGMVQVSR